MLKINPVLFLLLVWNQIAYSEETTFVEENYTKQEVAIPMRDGAKLFTAIYSPKDKTKTYPILFCRTPYGVKPYGEDKYPEKIGPSEYLMKSGYIIVYQDARGKFMSEGAYLEMTPHQADKTDVKHVDNSSDTFDSIEWLLKNTNNNGKVGLWGISYRGFYVSASIINAHPAIKCASPQAPISDWFIGDDVHHNGAFELLSSTVFFEVLGQELHPPYKDSPDRNKYPVGDAYNFFKGKTFRYIDDSIFKNNVSYWDTLAKHPNYDYYWKSRNIRKDLPMVDTALPVMVVGGWYDQENLFGSLQTYKALSGSNHNKARVVLGPWIHGGWARTDGTKMGILDFNEGTSDFYQKEIEFPFFQHYLKGEEIKNNKEAVVFETGTNRWKLYDHWPPYKTWSDTLFLNKDFRISSNKSDESGFKFDSYFSDPGNPVPYTDKFHATHLFYDKEYMNNDQRFASSRPDVLCYESVPLKDTFIIAGPVEVELYVITNCTDADFIVKLIDEYPEEIPQNKWVNTNTAEIAGYQMMVRGEIMRGKYRDNYTNPEPFLPGKVEKVSFTLNDINHAFLPGHKLQVQIQSSWFPLFDMNPQNFVNIYLAEPKDYRKAEIKIVRSKDYPSGLIFNKIGFKSGI